MTKATQPTKNELRETNGEGTTVPKIAGHSMRVLAAALTLGGAGTLAAAVAVPGGVASAAPYHPKPVPATSCTTPIKSTIYNPIDGKPISIVDPYCGFTPTVDSSGNAISTV